GVRAHLLGGARGTRARLRRRDRPVGPGGWHLPDAGLHARRARSDPRLVPRHGRADGVERAGSRLGARRGRRGVRGPAAGGGAVTAGTVSVWLRPGESLVALHQDRVAVCKNHGVPIVQGTFTWGIHSHPMYGG